MNPQSQKSENDGTKFSSINICNMNTRSLTGKIAEVNEIISQNLVDILAVTETWFTQNTPFHDTILKNFQNLFRRDRDTHGVGVSIFVRPNSSCTRRHDLEHTGIELIITEINLPHMRKNAIKSFLFCCCYRPPTPALDQTFFTALDEAIRYIGTKT